MNHVHFMSYSVSLSIWWKGFQTHTSPLFWYYFVFKVLLFLVGSSTLLMYLVLTHTFTCCRPSQSTSFVHPIWPINELLDHLIAKNVQSAHVKELFFFPLLVCVHALNSLVKRWNRERILHDKDMIRNSLQINFVKLKLRISEQKIWHFVYLYNWSIFVIPN